MVSLSLEGGINWFDTAEICGNGASEKALAKALLASNLVPYSLLNQRIESNGVMNVAKKLNKLTG